MFLFRRGLVWPTACCINIYWNTALPTHLVLFMAISDSRDKWLPQKLYGLPTASQDWNIYCLPLYRQNLLTLLEKIKNCSYKVFSFTIMFLTSYKYKVISKKKKKKLLLVLLRYFDERNVIIVKTWNLMLFQV